MRKLFIFFLASLLLSVGAVFAQPVRSAISVEVVNSDEDHSVSLLYPYKLVVNQEFYLNDNEYDTLRLGLKNTGFFQAINNEDGFFLIPEMFVQIGENGEDYRSVKFDFDGGSVTIPTDGAKYVKLTYDYYSDWCFKTDVEPFACALLHFNEEQNSWCFTVDGADNELSEVSIHIPPSVDLFANCPFDRDEDGKLTFQLDKMQRKTLSFYLVDKKWFERDTREIDDVQVTLYLSKKDSLNRDENEILFPLDGLESSYVQARWDEVIKLLSSLNSAFPGHEVTNITILEDNLSTKNRKYAYGTAVSQSDSEFALFVDFSFWEDHTLAHELVHGYLRHSNYDELDAKFFFDESMIEYFANYIYHTDSLARDEAFASRIEYFLSLPTDEHQSIFDIERNYVKEETGSGTWGVVYYKAPFLIHRLARKLGEDRFHEAVDAFYANAKKSDRCLFEDFGKTMMEFGVSEKDWEKFKKSL